MAFREQTFKGEWAVLADGHLSCPESVKERLHLEEGVEVKVVMEIEDSRETLEKGMGLTPREGTVLCGIWKDDRSAEEIIGDIYSSRTGFKEVKL
ncbi:hypothetical protein M1N79_04685 [Dehalococcoidia bacterium]|nr:hypothetical protein [Dehalococcoidia bacterium]